MQTEMETLLYEQPFTKGMSARTLLFLEEAGAVQSLKGGQELFHAGDEADHFYLVLKGKVEMVTMLKGRQAVPVQTAETGAVFGWSWLRPPFEWRLTAIAGQDTDLLAFEALLLRIRMEEDPDFRNDMMTHLLEAFLGQLDTTIDLLVDSYQMYK